MNKLWMGLEKYFLLTFYTIFQKNVCLGTFYMKSMFTRSIDELP